jgi:hypothetical protein
MKQKKGMAQKKVNWRRKTGGLTDFFAQITDPEKMDCMARDGVTCFLFCKPDDVILHWHVKVGHPVAPLAYKMIMHG